MAQKVALDNMEFLPKAKHFKVNVFLDPMMSKRLTSATCKHSIRKFVKEYSGELHLTDIQKKALHSLQNTQGSREQMIEQIKTSSIKHTTAYSTFERLTSLGLIIERQNHFVISGKARLLIEEA